MNAFVPAALWCILQVTLLAGFVVLWCQLLRRSNPATRSLATFTGLALIVALTLLTFSPWPAWSFASVEWPRGTVAAPNSGVASKADRGVTARETAVPAASSAKTDEPATTVRDEAADASSPAGLFWQSFLAELQRSGAPAPSAGWSWRELLIGLVAVGAAVGFLRLAVGLILVRTYRARSRWIGDPAILELRDVLQAELSCQRYVALYESDLLTTAATIGWREPLVILPANWREWTDDERRAVLAHEIAHIARHDFPTWVAAQAALVLHFYHPLVHWLCRNLRLEQELAADAAAAALAGGQQTYLTTLAAMALRQPDRPLAWPARTFLPTRGTFMRRIEMLRDGKLKSTSASTGARVGTVVVLAAAGLLIAGLRGTAAPPDAASVMTTLATGSLAQAGAAESTGLEWIPRDALVVATIRPAKLLARPELAGFATAISQQGQLKEHLGIAPERIEQVSLVLLGTEKDTVVKPGVGIVLRLTQASEAAAFLKGALPEATEGEYGGRKYLVRQGGAPQCGFADDRTVVLVEDEPMLRRMIVSGTTGASQSKWATGWSTVAGDDAAAIVNLEGLRSIADQTLRQGPGPLAVVAPLWQNANSLILSVRSEQKNFSLRGRLASGSPEDAKRVKDTLSAVVTIARNGISAARASAAQLPGQQGAMLLGAADIADAMLDTADVTQKDREVELSLTLRAEQVAVMASLLAPAVSEARGAARASHAMNNLRQIGLAMHQYQDQRGAFPAAVLYGPDGKTPYSWRVAILPFLDQEPLFRRYDFNQPWDSDTNKKVLAQMPAVLRDPSEPATSTNASYFALTGPETMFSNAAGVKPPDITDGMSYTIMVVEAKRAIPWTKPEDIPYAADKPLPQLGGYLPQGFLAALADGSVRVIGKMIDEKTLRALATKSGQEIVPNLDAPPQR